MRYLKLGNVNISLQCQLCIRLFLKGSKLFHVMKNMEACRKS